MEYVKDSNWIWHPHWDIEDKNNPCIMLFRKEIKLKEEAFEGKLNISADTRYKLYINGQLVETGPSRGDYKVWFYDTVDILAFLKKGTNIIGVSVLRYPEDPAIGNHGMLRTCLPGLYVTGKIQDIVKNEYDISADSSWKCIMDKSVTFYREEQRFAPLMIHEQAAGNPQIFGWKYTSYNDNNWKNAKTYIKEQIPEVISLENLKPRNIPYMYRKKCKFKGVMDLKRTDATKEEWMDFLNGKKELVIPKHTEVIVELDAGEEMTGYIKVAFSGGKAADVSLLYAEAYVLDEFVGPEHIPVKKDRMDKEHGHLHGYKDFYRVAGVGTQTEQEVYEPYWFRTFRFVRLHIQTAEESLTLHSLSYEETGYPLEIASEVKTSDSSLEAVWDISVRTLQRCMHETYIDCPFYEQLQYIMDARTQILYTYAVSADDRLARKCIDDLRRAKRQDGLLNCSYPNCNVNVIPTFSIYYILMLYDHMMYFGDRDLIAEHMPTVHHILDFFDRHLTPEGYVGTIGGLNREGQFWSFIDWANEWNDTDGVPASNLDGPIGTITMESLLYIYGLQHAGKLAEYIGQKENAKKYFIRAEKVQEALVKYCIGRDNMLQDSPGVDEYSQHCQVFGILTDTIDTKLGKKILLKTVQDKSYTQCTVAMSFYLFRALEKTGLYKYTDQYWDVWRNMIKKHCTTCVESEAYARSECHGWGALILYELPSVTLGVRPAEPGYKKIQVSPVTGYFTHASGKVKTPVGDVKVSWEIEDGNLKVDYKLPQGMEFIK